MPELNGTIITWLGHATLHIQTAKGTSILIDPFIEHNPKYPKGYELPKKIDLLLLTHGHSDHAADVISVAKKYEPTVVAIFELAHWLGSKKVGNVVGMNMGGAYKFQDVTATMVEARHSSSIEDDGHLIYGGEPAGFVIAVEGGPTIYLAGDTAVYSDMQLIRELHHPQLAILPIGDYYTMGPKAAALAAKYVGAGTVLPVHYGTFPPLTGTPDELKEFLKGTGIEVKAIQPGESLR
jgi:L-ascorbate metabolism protein UlaG (beta-lactamase superfamily)